MDSSDIETLGDDPYLFEMREINPGPKVAVVTQKTVGWSLFGELVSQNVLANPVPQKSLQLQVSFDKQMQTHTIQFNGPDNLAFGAVGAVIPEAEILWSVEGGTIRRVVTLADGMAICGAAQSVTINIYDQSFDAGIRYAVGCTVAPGPRGNTQQPPLFRTVTRAGVAPNNRFPFGVGLAPAASASWLVPANIGAISSFMTVLGAPPPAAALAENSVAITHYNGGFVPVQFYGLSGAFKYIPLYGGTRLIEITNNSPAAIGVAHHFGIEG